MIDFAGMTLEELIREGGYECECGRRHEAGLKYLKIGRDAVQYIPEGLAAIGVKRPFVVCDRNTRAAAWDRVRAQLEGAGVPYVLYCFDAEHLEPDERAMGALCMAFDPACDGVVAVGSGVINDCCKVLAHAVSRPQMVVGTAPSMDGYASNSSAMIRSGCKVTLFNACPEAVIADTMIMKDAPARMLHAGLGDMLAKYSALCEWRIDRIVNEGYYCEAVAALMRKSLDKIMANAPRLMERDPEVIGAVAEGLVLSGIAMAFAQVSRPASGLEHYFSHLWEMFALERGESSDLHGIQVGVGTNLTFGVYKRLRQITPDREKALAFVRGFDRGEWEARMRQVFGAAAEPLIESERTRWHQNDPALHAVRLARILDGWEEIVRAMDEELPPAQEIAALMKKLGMPMIPADLGVSAEDARNAFVHARDTRDKYLLSNLLWDLGLLEDFPLDL